MFIILASLLTNCSSGERDKVLKLAHGLDISHPVHKGMVYMAKQVEVKSGGKLTIKIYPGGQLGAERQCLELLQIGSLDMTKVSSAVMEGFAPKYRVLGLPYIFRDKAHIYSVLDGEIGDELLQEGSKYWLHGICFYDAGARSFYTIDKPILHPDDLIGMKIRVMKSNTAVEMVSAFGGSPTPISWGVLLMSTHTWDKLSDQERTWLKEAAEESVVEQRKLWAESEKEAFDIFQKAGVKVYYPDKAPFVEKVQGLYKKYEMDEELGDLIKRIRNYN